MVGASSGWALGAWLLIQLTALGLCAMRAAFWARVPRAGEQLALYVMLAVQVGASAMLFPLLLRNVRWTIFAIAAAWPLGELAAFLADVPMRRFAQAEWFVTLWLVTLYLWSRVLRTQWMRICGAAVAAMVCLGGPVLWYLRLEFHEVGRKPQICELANYGPITAAISQCITDAFWPASWAWSLIPMIFALFSIWMSIRCDRRREPIHK